MSDPENIVRNAEREEIQSLGAFDADYFKEIDGQDGWNALGEENCTNQQYFTVYGTGGKKLGIVGVYDSNEDKNLAHAVVEKKYRGQALAAKFYQHLLDTLKLPFITLTVNLDNTASLRATEKLPGVRKTSDEKYEQEFHKAKYVYER